jgi:UDP-N-acetylmuramate--alanine ligase
MRVHFIGIGGINMSSLAQLFLAEKWAVSGSDSIESVITRDLRKRGVKVRIGHSGANLPSASDLVIRNQAIQPGNPELRAAHRRRIPVITNAQMTGVLTRRYATIAVAGAHGKSTTTALAALMLVRAGLDPTVVVGTRLKEFGNNNFRDGGDVLVLEADEYGRSFLHYTPLFAIVTNIDAEHLDTYKNLAGVKKAYLHFTENIIPGGTLIVNRDDENLRALRGQISRIAHSKGLTVIWYSLHDRDAKKVQHVMQLPGKHNVSNALSVLCLARALNVPDRTTLSALHAFQGSWRRFEYRGRLPVIGYRLPVAVYDDYAHHPTEIRATLKAFREKFPNHKILCVFQPHQAERLKRLFKDFQDAFVDADITLLAPTYKVAGRDAEHPRYSVRALADAIRRRHPKQRPFYLENWTSLVPAVKTLLITLGEDACVPSPSQVGSKQSAVHRKKSDDPQLRTAHGALQAVIVMMGAGDIVDHTSRLIKR